MARASAIALPRCACSLLNLSFIHLFLSFDGFFFQRQLAPFGLVPGHPGSLPWVQMCLAHLATAAHVDAGSLVGGIGYDGYVVQAHFLERARIHAVYGAPLVGDHLEPKRALVHVSPLYARVKVPSPLG